MAVNLTFKLEGNDLAAAEQAVGLPIHYCVPANLSLLGWRTSGWLVVGEQRWASIENGEVKESAAIADGGEYKMLPLVGNVVLEATGEGGRRIVARAGMEHAARYGYIAQALSDMAAARKVRIFNNEEEAICEKCGSSLIKGTRVCPKCMSKTAAFKRLLHLSSAHWKGFALGLSVLLVVSVITLLGPYFQKLFINGALEPAEGASPSMHWFTVGLAGMVACLVVAELLSIVRERTMARVSSSIAADLRKLVYDKAQSLSLGFMTSQRAGDMMNRITSDTERIRHLLQELCTTAVFQIIMLGAASTLLFIADWRLAIIVLLPAPLVGYFQFYIWQRVLWKLFHKQWTMHDRANSFLHDVLSGIRVVKAFGKEEREIERFRSYNADFAAATIRSEKVFSILSPITNYAIQIGQYVVLLLGANMILNNEMNVGELIQFSMYASMVFGPITWLMFLPRWMADALISTERIFSVIDEQPEIRDAEKPVSHTMRGAIQFRNVYFGYKSYEPVLKNIHLDIRPGEMIGLVGHSGSGKSTMINLVSRFYDVQEGDITIDGVSIKEMEQAALRAQIGVVLQETFLFSGTIIDNIRYSKPEATYEEVIEAARIANAHSFIINQPDGYDTWLEENGNNLSGGERQRLAIARAILHNPRVIILDEATASLDIETESAIQEALRRVTRNRTTIAIAHRLSTLRNADRLVVLEKGAIAEVGTHNELMDKKGIYYGLINAQREMSRSSKETAAGLPAL